MSGTRDLNTPGNYAVEQEALQKERQNLLYAHGPGGHAYQTALPGLGFGASRMGSAQLAKNFADIESDLYGISSNNLVSPLPELKPKLLEVPTANVFQKAKVVEAVFPERLTDQRLRLVHSDETVVRREH
jgi:hypothetical protein